MQSAQTKPLAASGDPESYILQQIVQMQYANKRMATWGSYLISLLYGVAASLYLPTEQVLGWVAWLTAVTLGRHWLSHAFSKATLNADNAARWQRYIVIDAAAAGTTWGLAALMLFTGTPFEIKLIVSCLIPTLSIVIIYSSAGHLPTFLAYCLPACGLTAIMLFGQMGGVLNILTGLSITAAPFILSKFARTVQKHTVETMRLRFENSQLIDQLQQEKQIAIQANEQKSRFLAAASHDLRQPLHALGLFAASLTGSKLSPTQTDMLKGVLNSHQAMTQLFDALLDISKLDAGAIEVNLDHFPLQRMFDRLTIEFFAITSERNIKLRFYPTSLWVRSDPVLLERILRNLINNALRYTKAGRVVVGVRRRAAYKPIADGNINNIGYDANSKATQPLPQAALHLHSHVEIQVFDTGVGIEPEQLESIFEEFYQIGNAERDRRKGLGLGLPIVKRLATLLSHRIKIVSNVGRGSMFGIAVQRGTSYKLDQTITHPLATRSVASRLTNKLVLIIDDELDIRAATTSLLESWDVRVLAAASRLEALNLLATEPTVPSCILCDYRLGEGENGIAVIAAIREEYVVDIPALLITGDTAPNRIAEAQASGLSVLHKPIDGARLKRTIFGLIAAAETAAELDAEYQHAKASRAQTAENTATKEDRTNPNPRRE